MSTSFYVEVVPLLDVDSPFIYELKEELGNPDELTGHLALAPWRNSFVPAVITGQTEKNDNVKNIKTINDLITFFPLLTEDLIKLCFWISEYYLTPIGTVFKSILPEPRKISDNFMITLTDKDNIILHPLLERLKTSRKKELSFNTARQLFRDMKFNDVAMLEREGFVKIRYKEDDYFHFDDEAFYWLHKKNLNKEEFNKKQGKSIESLLQNIYPVKGSWIKSQLSSNRNFLKILIEKDILLPFPEDDKAPWEKYEPSLEQKKIIDQITDSFSCKGIKKNFLYGVTGSGKTIIYLHLIKKVIESSSQALLLVPEISLTPQNLTFFQQFFKSDEIMLYHSMLPHNLRINVARMVNKNSIKLIIGPRSALFLPFKNLGLIIMDEEYETSYKQDNKPRYHARRVAIERAKLADCHVVFASATPSIETYYFSGKGYYRQYELRKRFGDKDLPEISIVDMKKERFQGNYNIVSRSLRSLLSSCLREKKQALLLYNRRGFASYVICEECGEPLVCPHCDFNLTFYLKSGYLICHYCLYRTDVPPLCPSCKAEKLKLMGSGTEKLELELNSIFPSARIARIDRESIINHKQFKEIFDKFSELELDILVGTQMIAKGLHFPQIAVVGVIGADIGLNLPDFRASEKLYQMLTQVSGRSGRGDTKGKVVIQTYTPYHPVMEFIRNREYEPFYDMELKLREKYLYPPFASLILITLLSMDQNAAKEDALRISDILHAELNSESNVLEGAFPAVVTKKKDFFRWQIIIKTREARIAKSVIKKCLKSVSLRSDIEINVDPMMII